MQMGLEIARRLRANFSASKIIVISQHDPAALTAQAIDAGVNGCLDKGRLGMDWFATIQRWNNFCFSGNGLS